MFSSLPSASKLYASSSAKNKQKSNVSNAKRKRRRSKVHFQVSVPEVEADANTLIASSKISKKVPESECDSDFSEIASNGIVKFCIESETNVEETENLTKEFTNVALDDNSSNTTELQKELKETLPIILEDKKNVIVTLAEIHHDSSVDQVSDGEQTADEGEVDGSNESLQLVYNQTPIIIISSVDSPEQSLDLYEEQSDGIPKKESSTVDEDSEFVADRFNVPAKFSPYETIDEGDEFEDVLVTTGQDSDLIINSIVKEGNFPVSFEDCPDNTGDCSINSRDCQDSSKNNLDNSKDCPDNSEGSSDNLVAVLNENSKLDEKTLNDHLNVPENEGFDDASISSDCCPSKNIYNDYFTDAIDEIDDNFMIDDPRSTSSDGEDSTPLDSDEVENQQTESPRNSEVSGTESSLGSGKKIDKSNSVEDKVCQTSVESTSLSRRLRRAKALAATKNERTKSLPDFLEFKPTRASHCQSSVNNETPVKTCTSNVSVATSFQNRMVQTSFRSNSIPDSLSGSCTSSASNLSAESCRFSRVMPPVSVQEARLRSYMVGSVKATGSLLGVEELTRYFPDKKVHVFVGTWNMNGQNPPKCINDFLLPLGVSHLPDIYAIGAQECSQSQSEWDILMQTTLGPSHVLFMSTSLGVLHLAIFIRRDLVWFCSEPEDSHVTTRPGSMVKTKGAVAISFVFFGSSFLFINSHLTAHERKLKERLSDYEKICNLIDLPKKIPLKPQYQSKDATSRFDNVFWCGDLNFRVVQDRPSVLSFVEEKLQQTIHTCDFLLRHDQLQKAMNDGVAFHGFEEGKINFVPSYKFDVGTQFFNSTKQRVPSYTDRVLFRCKRAGSIGCIHYNVVSDILTSDHKPVFAVFEVEIRPGRDNIPLAAGQFKREVYLEANRRRAMALEVKTSQKSSTVCSIM